MPEAEEFDPQDFVMTLGDHLEELRHRLILALYGMGVAALICLTFGQRVVSILCKPLIDALEKSGGSPQIYTHDVADGFMVYIKMSLIAAAAISSPWIIYQLWLFVSAGLYPRERKYITKYIPLSIILLLCGMAFVYFIVLPWSLTFFLDFANGLPVPSLTHTVHASATTMPTFFQALPGDPAKPLPNQVWLNTVEGRVKFFFDGRAHAIPFGADNLLNTQFTLPEYLDLVLQLLITFGLAFQLPLVVMAVVRIGLVEIQTMRKLRRYVYFGLSLLAAVLSPGDVVTATIALLAPLILLYEFGLLLAVMGGGKAKENVDNESPLAG